MIKVTVFFIGQARHVFEMAEEAMRRGLHQGYPMWNQDAHGNQRIIFHQVKVANAAALRQLALQYGDQVV